MYITNSGYNRIEVFDIRNSRFLDPIPVGQLPHQMALGTDGTTLYVGNTGGESLSMVDLDLRRVVGSVEFPPLPRQGGGNNANPAHPRAMAMGLFGLQFVMSNGTQWKLVGQSGDRASGEFGGARNSARRAELHHDFFARQPVHPDAGGNGAGIPVRFHRGHLRGG